MTNIDFTAYGTSGLGDITPSYNLSRVVAPTKTEEKSSKLQERLAVKQDKLGRSNLAQQGFADPVANVLSSNAIQIVDADTYRVPGREDSTRTLGVDTYETTKPNYDQWIQNPNMQAKMDRQVAQLSQELGRPATYADVFAAGDKQKADAVAYTRQPLLTLLQETLLSNEDTQRMKSGDIVNYGRDLGHLETLGGLYTKPDGTTGSGVKEVLGSNRVQAIADVNTYGNAKYGSPASNTKPGNLSSFFDAVGSPDDRSVDDRGYAEQAGSFVQGVAQGALQTGVLDTIDFIGEASGIGDFGTEEEKSAMATKITGYDTKYSEEYMQKNKDIFQRSNRDINPEDKSRLDTFIEDVSGPDGVINTINKVVTNMSTDDFVEVISNSLANTDTTAYSLGMLIGMVAGTKGAGLAKVGVAGGKTAQETLKSIKASTRLSKAEKRGAKAAVLDEAYKNANMLQKSINQVGKNSGLLVINAGQVNNQLDDFEKNAGRPATAEEKVEKYFANLGGLLIDRTLDVGILKGAIGKENIDAISDILRFGPIKAADEVAKDVGKLGTALLAAGTVTKATAKVAGAATIAAGSEFPTEALQTAIEEYNKVDYSTEKGKEQFREKALDILNAAFAGAAGGAHMSIGGQAVTATATGLGIVADKAQERATKLQAAEAAKAPKSTAQAATAANPNIDPEILNQEVQRLNQAKLDSDVSSTTPINREAYTAAMEAEQSVERVSDVGNIEEISSSKDNTNKAIIEAVTPFDDAYAEAIIQTKEFSNANKEVDTPGSTGQYRNMMGTDGIPYMQELMQKAIEAGAGPEKQKAMLQRINNLVTLANSSTVKELDSLVDSRFNDIKPENAVATIIGSSAASKRHIGALREAVTSLSELESKALEFKEEVLTRVEKAKESKSPTIDEVAVQKIIGGGAKPGVMQWIANLTNGNEVSIKQDVAKIKNFVEGQQAKIDEYKKALDSFDIANGITIGDYTKADYDKRAAERSKKSISPTDRTIDVEGTTYNPYSLSSVIEVAGKEQVKLNELLALAEKKAPKVKATESKDKAPRSPKEVSEDKVPAKDEKEPTEASKSEDITGAEKQEARMYNIAADMANGRSLSKEDKQFASDNKTPITKLINSDADLKAAMIATNESNKSKSKSTPTTQDTSPESQKGTEKAQTKSEGKSGKEEVKESPKGDMEAKKDSTSGILPEQGKRKTTIDTVEINAELQAIDSDIKYLEESKEFETPSERINTNREIDLLVKKAEKLQATLEIEGTVGDRLLANTPPKRKKRALMTNEKQVKLADFFEAKQVFNNMNLSKDVFEMSHDEAVGTTSIKDVTSEQFKMATSLIGITKKYINKFVAFDMDQSGVSDIDVTDTTNAEAFQSLSRLLLEGEPDNYTLPDEVVTVMAIAINDWMVNADTDRAVNRDSVGTNRLLGKPGDSLLSNEEVERVNDIDGLVTTAASSIGSTIYKNLGLRVKPIEGHNNELIEAKFKTELGLMGLAALESNSLITTGSKPAAEIFGKSTIESGSVNHFRFTTDSNGKNAWLDNSKKRLLLSMGSKAATKVLGLSTTLRYPDTKAPLKDRAVKNASAMGKFYSVAKKSVEAVNRQEATEWVWNDEYMGLYFDMVKTAADKQKFKELLGWKNSDEVHEERRASVNGKNLAITSNIEFLEDWYSQMKESKASSMWFKYKFVKNGRFILDSNTFNPQGKKLHRFAIYTGSHTVTAETELHHNMSLAMAFGVDIDKQSHSKSIKQWDSIRPQLDKMIDEGKSSLEVFEQVISNKWTHDPEHTLAGIAEYKSAREYIKVNGSIIGFESKMPLETDAVTSGFILKVLQMPIIRNVREYLKKGGVFTSFNQDTSFGSTAEEAGFLDAYNTPAQVMRDLLPGTTSALTAGLDDKYKVANKRATELALNVGVDEVVEISRSFMKSPFMTFNYGSGLSTIITSIGNSSIESLYDKIATKDPKDPQFIQAVEIIRSSGVGMEYDYKNKSWGPKGVVVNSNTVADKLLEMPFNDRLKFKLPKAIENNLRSNISAGVGAALEQTFKDTYGDYIEAGRKINNSFTVMFRLFKQRFDKAVEAKQKEVKRHLTDAETVSIVNSLEESLPAIKTALGDAKSKMMIFGTEAANYTKIEGSKDTGQARVRRIDGDLSAQAKFYKLVESYASGAVIPIHFIDGSIQSEVLSEMDVLGVHDANMFYIDNVVEGTRAYNKATAEISNDYSLTSEILKSLDTSIGNATKEEIAEVNKEYLKDNKGKEDTASTVSSIRDEMAVLDTDVQKAREDLFSSEIRFEHAAYEGSHYDWEPEGKVSKGTSSEEVIQHPLETKGSAIMSGINAEGDRMFHLSPGMTNKSTNPFDSNPRYRQYSEMYSNKIIEVIAPTIIKDSEFLTRQFSEGYFGNIVLGEYKPQDNTVFLAEMIGEDIDFVLDSHYNKNLEATASKATPTDPAVASVNAALIKEYVNSVDADYVRFHELVHAGSVSYMIANPEDKLTKRVEELYDDVVASGALDPDGIWFRSKEEFLAEGMSNPEVIKVLMSIKPKTPKEYFMNAFDVLIDTALSMVGLKGERKGTIHDYLVDTFTAMLLSQEQSKVDNESIKNDIKLRREGKGPAPVWSPELKASAAKFKNIPVARISEFTNKELAIQAGDQVRDLMASIESSYIDTKVIAAEVAKTTNSMKKAIKEGCKNGM